MNELDTLFDTLFRRSVGMDRLPQFSQPMKSFPPYNIVRVDDEITEIHVAAAGYSADDIKVFERNGVLHIESDGGAAEGESDSMIYRGIAKRSFKLTFALNHDVEIDGAACDNGMIIVRMSKSTKADNLIEIQSSLPALSHDKQDSKVLEMKTGS